jgi:HAD superfamily hydrolase (TIGR01549 family)
MKAVLVAAGSGTRCKPYSLTKSKILTPFLGKPLLFYHLDEFKHNDLTDVVIVCSKDNSMEIAESTKKAYPDMKIAIAIQDEQLGPSNAIQTAERLLKDEEFVLFKYADSMHEKDLVQPTLDVFEDDSDGVLTLREVEDPSRYGIARLQNDRVIEIVEKPQDPPSNLAVVGIGILRTEKFLAGLAKDKLFKGKKEVVPQEYVLREGGKLTHWVYDGKRTDLGKPWDVLLTNRLLLDRFGGKVEGTVDQTAKVDETSYVGKNAIIGKNVVITNYSSVEGVVRDGTLVEGSVIMKDSQVGLRCVIANSVIGENNKIGDEFETKDNVKDEKVFVKDKDEAPPLEKLGLMTGKDVVIHSNLHSKPAKVVYPGRNIKEHIDKDRILRAGVFDAADTLYLTGLVVEDSDKAAMQYLAKQCDHSAEDLHQEWRDVFVKELQTSMDPKKRHRFHSLRLLAMRHNIPNVEGAYKAFMQKLTDLLRPAPGVQEVLPQLKDFKLAVMTEDPEETTKAKLLKLGLTNHFDLIITSDQIGKMKPDKAYFDTICKQLGVTPRECIVVGDNYEKDLSLPHQDGALTVEFGGATGKADHKINDHNELLDIVKQL